MNILIISTSRADWNALGMVAKRLAKEHTVSIAGPNGAQLPSVGNDGFAMLPFFPEIDDDIAWARDFSLVILLGDRHELVPIAFALNYAGIPIAHLSGGDLTAGSKDDAYRHAITKLSHLHFPTHADSAARIIQMGEQPDLVHMVGSPAVDRILATELPAVSTFSSSFALLNWQSESLGTLVGLHKIIAALDAIPTVAVGCNDDPNSDQINDLLKKWCAAGRNRHFHQSLPTDEYLTAMRDCQFMIGNSSSMFYEAPYFGTPCVYVGTRQNGRLRSPNIVLAKDEQIKIAIRFAENHREASQPYGDGHAADRIAAVIGTITEPRELLRKEWYRG